MRVHSIEHTQCHGTRRGVRGSGDFTRKFPGIAWRPRDWPGVVSGGPVRGVRRRGDARGQEPAPARDEVAGQDHRPAGRGDLRACHPMTWWESSRAWFAPTRQIKPRCVPANDADFGCCNSIVLPRRNGVRASLGQGLTDRYTQDMAYCIGRANIGRRLPRGMR